MTGQQTPFQLAREGMDGGTVHSQGQSDRWTECWMTKNVATFGWIWKRCSSHTTGSGSSVRLISHAMRTGMWRMPTMLLDGSANVSHTVGC